jgi:predicted amidohydrolase YtcJ
MINRAEPIRFIRKIGSLVFFLFFFVFSGAQAADAPHAPDLILHNGDIFTLDPLKPRVQALSIRDGLILETGKNSEILSSKTSSTQVLDLAGRTVMPGLNDSHIHAVRGGRFYNSELRWDGIESLSEALGRVREQAERTPDGKWVRVIGGWSPFQFVENRMPTPAELSEAAPNTPVFVLFLYSRGFLNKAGVEALGLNEKSVAPDGGRYEFTPDGGAILLAEPNPTILYKTIGALPHLSAEEQINSTRHYYRELNRFGLTSAVDAGGGGHSFPENYRATANLAENGQLNLRVSNFLFPQRPGKELADFKKWSAEWITNLNLAESLEHGYEVEGAGEFLVWAAGDFENFTADRPDLTDRENWDKDLEGVVKHLLEHQWPLRIHATYDESITHILDVFERVHEGEVAAGRPGFFGTRWAIDHAETIGAENLERISDLGGGIAIQARLAYAGEYFVDRYGSDVAMAAPPVRDMIEKGIPLGVGTDATRVGSYNPWLAIHWLITGETVGGKPIRAKRHLLSREEAIYYYTVGSAWFSGDENSKGRLAPGQYGDVIVLSDDYFSIPTDAIKDLESVLTIVDGRIVYAVDEFEAHDPGIDRVKPTWSPVGFYYNFAED